MYKILVQAPNWVGDGVMATPMLAALRSNFPSAEITVLSKPAVSALLSHHPAMDRIWSYENPGRDAGVIGFLRLIAALRKERFNAVFLLRNAFSAALIAFMAGIPERVGYDTDGRGFLLTKRLSHKDAPRHQRDAFYKIGQILSSGASGQKIPCPTLFLTEAERTAASLQRTAWGISPDDFVVGICPGSASGSAKRWIPERFAEVADQLIRRRKAKILILGGPNDHPVGETVLSAMKEKGILLTGKLSLREMMAVISLCQLCLSNDSGPMHIASALGIPYIALFGPGLPEASFPGEGGGLIYHAVNCSPCSFVDCPIDHSCMTRISVEAVLHIIDERVSVAVQKIRRKNGNSEGIA